MSPLQANMGHLRQAIKAVLGGTGILYPCALFAKDTC